MQEIVNKYETAVNSPYLLPIITSIGKDERAQYKTMLHNINTSLKKVATLERTLTTVGMFETFKATLEINGMDLEKPNFMYMHKMATVLFMMFQ